MRLRQTVSDIRRFRPQARVLALESIPCRYPIYVVCDEDGQLYNDAGVCFWNKRWQANLVRLRAKLMQLTVGHPADIRVQCAVAPLGFRLTISNMRYGQLKPEKKTFNITLDEERGALFGEPGHEKPYRFAVQPNLPFFGAYELNHFLGLFADTVANTGLLSPAPA